jgi:hypothetical protein
VIEEVESIGSIGYDCKSLTYWVVIFIDKNDKLAQAPAGTNKHQQTRNKHHINK